MARSDHTAVLESIHTQRKQNPLSILTLAEPILQNDIPLHHNDNDTSNNDSSHNSEAQITPTALTADLAHYQSLFSKLRFSYLEQVTKEKYLRSIVGDPPVLVTHEENALLEEKLVGMKSDLKAKKEEVDQLVREMEELARQVAQRYEGVNIGISQLETLPKEIEDLEVEVADLKEELRHKEDEMNVDVSDDPRMNMNLNETQDLIAEQRRKTKEVEAQIEALQRNMPGKTRECERTERELEELESRRNEATRVAREVRRIKEEGGRDLLEEKGRWYRSSDTVMRGLLGIEA